MIKIGAHVAFKSPNYFVDSGKYSLSINANSMMIFLGPPQNSKRVSIQKMRMDKYLKEIGKKIPLQNILVHCPYIVNPANPEKSRFSFEFISKELKMMEELGLKFYVLHPGASVKYSLQIGLDTCVNNLKKILANTKNTIILLETMSGKGTQIGFTLEQLSYIIKKVDNERIGICLDTCHLWAAGYDLVNYKQFINQLKNNQLIDKIHAIHVNNSLMEFNSKKDRHASLLKGTIPFKALKKIVNSNDFMNAIKILETPKIGNIYKEEIEILLKK